MTEGTSKCPHCFSEIDARAAVCPVCKRDIKPPQRAKDKGNPVIRALAIISLVVICCVGGSVISLPLLTNSTGGNTNDEDGESPAATELPSITSEPAPPLAEILSNYREMTDAQWNTYAESLIGKRANEWAGRITEVDEGEILGGFTIYVRADGASIGESVFIDVPEGVAMALSKDQRIVFSGDITTASNAFGLTIRIDNAEIKTVSADR